MKIKSLNFGKKNTALIPILITGLMSIFALQATNVNAQVCNNKQTPQTISIRNFVEPNTTTPLSSSASSTGQDLITGLVWNRCVYGQNWIPEIKQCIGSPIILTWREALDAAANEGLRLPNIKELNSILNLQCINPPYDLDIFPDTFASDDHGLWTSSPHVDNPTVPPNTPRTNAWYIDLGAGITNYRDIDNEKTKNFARFVR